MDKSKIAIGLAILLSVVATLVAFGRPNVITKEIVEKSVGAVPSPDMASPYMSFGGVRSWAYETRVKETGSTTCSILSPAATTTLVRVTSNFERLASSTQVEIGLGTTAFATTTSLGIANMPTGGGLLVSSSTSHLHRVITPLTYVNTKIGGGDTAGTLTPVGLCTAVFTEV